MPRIKLTDAVVRSSSLPDGRTETTIWDTDVTGFGLRLRRGAATYILAYRPAGAGRGVDMRRLKIGSPETIKTATEARTLARAALGKIASGGDPHTERQEKKRREKAKISDLLDRYEADLKRRRYVNRKTVIDGLKMRLKPHLKKDIKELAGSDYAGIIETIELAGQAGAAADFRSRCSAFLSWCVSKPKVLPANPLATYRKERATRADRLESEEPGRALSDDELMKVWQAASPATTFGRYARFLILTGCRRGEGSGLSRKMIDRSACVIHLPALFVKQGRGHDVPIAPTLAELLDACPVDARSDLVFASPKTGGRMSGWTQMIAKLVKASGVEFTLHDLRRTFRTGLSRLGTDQDIGELAIGHARDELEAIYNKDAAKEALRIAFSKWADHVTVACASRND